MQPTSRGHFVATLQQNSNVATMERNVDATLQHARDAKKGQPRTF
jgi:hypothetical protein